MFKDLYLIAGIIGILSLVFVWVLISIGLIYKQQDTNKIEKILSTLGTIFALFILWRVFVTSGDLGILLLIGSVVSFTLMILGYFIDQSKKIFRAARGWFIPFFLIFVVRNFLYEPYQIPSESMVPGLQVGDFILVEKFTYGLKIDRTSSPFALADTPEYGDVVVFIPPHDPRPFVKRLVGKPGDKITISGPYGEFHINETEREMIYIGGGAGMAPLRSHIFHLFHTQKTKRKVSYWYGGRTKKELFYMDHFRKIEKDFKNFNFFVGLSEPLPEDNWEIKKKLEDKKDGYVGFIHQVLYDNYLSKHKEPEDVEYYLCGPPLMNQAVLQMLEDMGVPDENIRFDDFGG